MQELVLDGLDISSLLVDELLSVDLLLLDQLLDSDDLVDEIEMHIDVC